MFCKSKFLSLIVLLLCLPACGESSSKQKDSDSLDTEDTEDTEDAGGAQDTSDSDTGEIQDGGDTQDTSDSDTSDSDTDEIQDGGDTQDGGDDEEASLEQLAGNTFVFEPDRLAINVNNLSAEGMIDESEFQPIKGAKYSVTFSDDGRNVAIKSEELSGTLESQENEMNIFQIKEGQAMDMGGRFSAWIENNAFQAELAQYGTSALIRESERGPLTQDN